MKIAITGHSSGIGLALAKVYQSHGHEVVGFSRDNGFDISDRSSRSAIVAGCSDCACFINNAYSWDRDEHAQLEMLFDIWSAWQSCQKSIINIGSSTTMNWNTDAGALKYRNYKAALENTCEYLANRCAWPAVSLIAPCLTDTNRTQHLDRDNKVNADVFATMVYDILQATDFRVQVLKLAVNPES